LLQRNGLIASRRHNTLELAIEYPYREWDQTPQQTKARPNFGNGMALALFVDGTMRTGEELTARSMKAAAGLRSMGIMADDKVAILLPNGFEFLEAWKAIGALGALAYPLSTDLKVRDLAEIVRRESFKAAIVDPQLPNMTALANADILRISAEPHRGSEWDQLIETAPGELPENERCQPPGTVFATSGSTGVPKTVRRLPLEPAVAELRYKRFQLAWGMDRGMHTVVTGPMHHQAPLYWATGAVEVAELIVIQRKFDARELLDLIARHRITHLHMVPRMFQRLLEIPEKERLAYDVSSLAFVLHGAGPVSIAQKQAMVDWWGPIFREYYATSEFGILSLSDIADFLERPTSVGRPFEGVKLEIRGPDELPLPRGHLGAIFMASDDMPPFSYNRGEGPQEAGRRGEFISVGDMGFFDEDGYLHLAGRGEDKAVIGGVNFFARPVEEALARLPYVREAAVVAVHDPRQGDAFAAYVVLRDGIGSITEQRIIQDLRPHVERHCVPRKIELMTSLPRFDSGKTFRRDLVGKGVKLMESDADPMPSGAPRLGPRFPAGVTVEALEEADSTNTVALARVAAGAPHLTLVWAKRQTAGRGRERRTWSSPEGNVFWSMVVRPDANWSDISELTFVTALAVHAAVRPHVSKDKAVTLKWPNDTLIGGAKVSGALLEAIGVRRNPAGRLTADAVVVGIGINIATHPVDGIMYPATSLSAEGSLIDRDHMLGDLTGAFLGTLDLWQERGFPAIRDLYLERAHGLKSLITVRASAKPDDQMMGVFEGIDAAGFLELRSQDGSLRKISAGDVFFKI
jgi:long-chain acyl-CoA synthetase